MQMACTISARRFTGLEYKGEPSTAVVVDYTLKRGQLTDAGSGSITLTNGTGSLDAKIDEPGTILGEFKIKNATGRGSRVLAGAIAARSNQALRRSPRRLRCVLGRQGERARGNSRKREAGKCRGEKTECGLLENRHGQHSRLAHSRPIARPKTGEKFPAILIVQWAGVYPLDKSWVTDRTAGGWLAGWILKLTIYRLISPRSFIKIKPPPFEKLLGDRQRQPRDELFSADVFVVLSSG